MNNFDFMLIILTPEWVSAISSAIGVPSAIVGFIILFIKDRNKERKINSLENMVEELKNHTLEMNKQSGHLLYQASLMKESNDMHNEYFKSLMQTSKRDLEMKVKDNEFKNRKRINDIKPFFVFSSSSTSPVQDNNFVLILKNEGGKAIDVKIKEIDTSKVTLSLNASLSKDISKDEVIRIVGSVNLNKSFSHPKDVTYQVVIEYVDIDGNKYNQQISKLKDGNYDIKEAFIFS